MRERGERAVTSEATPSHGQITQNRLPPMRMKKISSDHQMFQVRTGAMLEMGKERCEPKRPAKMTRPKARMEPACMSMGNQALAMRELAKGILRAKFNLSVNKDGTIRYDGTEIPLTHFKPFEIRTSIDKLK